MALLTRDERARLIELLLLTPLTHDPVGRLSLLATLHPNLHALITGPYDTQTFIVRMLDLMDSDAWAVQPDGARPLIIVLENARIMVEGSWIADELRNLALTLQVRIAEGGMQPLRQPLASDLASPSPIAPPAVRAELRRLLVEIQDRLYAAIAEVDNLHE